MVNDQWSEEHQVKENQRERKGKKGKGKERNVDEEVPDKLMFLSPYFSFIPQYLSALTLRHDPSSLALTAESVQQSSCSLVASMPASCQNTSPDSVFLKPAHVFSAEASLAERQLRLWLCAMSVVINLAYSMVQPHRMHLAIVLSCK